MLANSDTRDIRIGAIVEAEEGGAIRRPTLKLDTTFKGRRSAWPMWSCLGIAAASWMLVSAAVLSADYQRVNASGVDGQSAATPLARLRAKTGVEPVANLLPEQVAGRYANPPKDLVQSVGPPLVGNSLYIFPDKTYVYGEWAVVMPTTVFDKGTWRFAGGVLELRSDREVIWNPDLERKFLAVRRSSHAEEMLLVGAEKALRRIEKQVEGDPELMLLRVATSLKRSRS